MPRERKTGRAANGLGSIHKKTVKRNGKEYTYWEARYTEGFDPGTGKQVQRSITGKTQKEVREKLQEVSVDLNHGTYVEPSRMTVGEWMDIWTEEFLVNVKPRTLESYQDQVRLHIKPAMGAVKLQELKTFQIQRFYNDLSRGKKGKSGLSPKTVKNIHGILHRALGKAVALGYLRVNPCEGTELPRIEKKEIKPLDDAAIMEFLKAIQGNPYEDVFMLTLFTGLRRGEVCGLTWDCVDFQNGTLLIKQQLQKIPGERAAFRLVTTKNSKWRTLTPAASVMEVLRKTKVKQAEKRLFVAPAWEDGNFVFTNDLGHHLSPHTVYHNYKRIVMEIGRPDARFHDLRHSYAVAALKNGDPIKTLQETLGHHSAAFTLDVYGHVTDQMKRESADRMEQFIKSVSGQ